MRKTKYYQIVTKKGKELLLNSEYTIIRSSGNFQKYFRLQSQHTRKISIRNEPRLKLLKAFDGIGIYKQEDYKPHNKVISKVSNTDKLNSDRALSLIGKSFFKHSVSHFLKMNGGYKMKTIYN